MADPGLEDLFAAFLRHLAHERCLSDHTLSSYRRDLTRFRDWLRRGRTGPWERLDQQTVRSYVAWRHRGGVCFQYRVSYRRLLELQARLFGRFLQGELDAYPNFTPR